MPIVAKIASVANTQMIAEVDIEHPAQYALNVKTHGTIARTQMRHTGTPPILIGSFINFLENILNGLSGE